MNTITIDRMNDFKFKINEAKPKNFFAIFFVVRFTYSYNCNIDQLA